MDAIRNVLEVISKSCNEYLQNLDRRPDDWVALSNLVDHQGKINEETRDKIVISLYSITHETVVSTYTAAQPGPGGYAIVQPPLYIDLHIIALANFIERSYADGLAAISRVVSYFQQNPVFSHANAPDLDPTVDKIQLEFTSLGPVDVNYVVGMLGAKYLPSVFYKLRLIPFVSNAMQARTYPARGQNTAQSADNRGEP
ncbi:MAG: DUF4255 domain-containing protein [Proteobacteria bacterium]|nr:DUF4255 domain-containing protein [Pseudomonadota bacterium]